MKIMIEKILIIVCLKFKQIKARQAIMKMKSKLKNAIHDIK